MRILALTLALLLSSCSQPNNKTNRSCPLHSYDNSKLLDGTLSYEAPSTWQVTTATNSMRLAEYIVDIEHNIRLAVHFFPGIQQSVHANTTRWKQQFQDDDKRVLIENKQFNLAKLPVTVYHITGNYKELSDPMDPQSKVTIREDYALMAAIVELKEGSWFFKMIGPRENIAQQRANLDKLIYSFKRIKKH